MHNLQDTELRIVPLDFLVTKLMLNSHGHASYLEDKHRTDAVHLQMSEPNSTKTKATTPLVSNPQSPEVPITTTKD